MKKLAGFALVMMSFAFGALSTRSIHPAAQAQSAVADKESRSALAAKKGVRCEVRYEMGNANPKDMSSGIQAKTGIFNSVTDKWIVLDGIEEREYLVNENGQVSDANGRPAYRIIKKQYWIATNSITTMAFDAK